MTVPAVYRPRVVPIDIPGGPTRPSVLVDVPLPPAVERRRELDRRLRRDCFVGEDDRVTFDANDLDLLMLITRERFTGADGQMLRQRAVAALGTIDQPAVRLRLLELALNPLEDDGVRLAALAVLPPARVRRLLPRLAADLSPAVRQFARSHAAGVAAPRVTDREPPFCPSP
jgi:hypothetical protein